MESSGISSNASASTSPLPTALNFFPFVPESSSTDSNPPSPPLSDTSIDALEWKLGYDSPEESPVGEVLDIISQFRKGEDEAKKYLTLARSAIEALEDLQNFEHKPDDRKRKTDGKEERSTKQFASSSDEVEIWEMIDKLLLSDDVDDKKDFKEVTQFSYGRNDSTSNSRKRRGRDGNKREVVDLWSLLVNSARAVASYDRQEAGSLISVIRKHSSPLGDATQRFAHYLVDGLEGRLSDWGCETHSSLACNKSPVIEILKAHKLLSVTPMKKIPMEFAKENIAAMAQTASTLHIVDFGIRHGTQWPGLIKLISTQPGGPPKLRITGIELPEFGLRPAWSTLETGRRLAECCDRFRVEFEYNPIVSAKWETIRIEDLKINPDETVAVNCLFRLGALLDESVMEVGNPRDGVLKLIREMKPHIFVHSVLSGPQNSPFFVSRFKESMHHYSNLFDMLDSAIGNADSAERLAFEREHIGQSLINVIACDGWSRVVRTERYQDWERRMISAGLRTMPLNKELASKLRDLVRTRHHRHFRLDEDGHWLLHGWKGRIINAMSCWFAPR